MADPFQFELVSPEKLVLSEPALQVVVPGSEGQFTVLKGHAPLMAVLRPGVIEATLAGGQVRRIFVRGGFADTTPEVLTILAEVAVPVEELNAERLAAEIKDAEEDVADAPTDEARTAAALKLNQLREVQTVLGQSGPGGHH